MEVSAESVKSFLESASLMGSVSDDLLSRYTSLYERATKSTSVITGMPGGGGSDREAVLAALVDAEDDADRWKAFATNQRELVKKFLQEAEIDDSYRELLFRRYITGVGWDFILVLMNERGSTCRRQMFYNHKRALEACADWVNRTGKYKEAII